MSELDLIAEFTVLGEAKTAGSKKAFVNPKTGRAVVTDATGPVGKAWRADVKMAAGPLFDRPVLGALAVEILFVRARPRGHYGSGRNADVVKPGASTYPTTRPDVDKLSRAILDALTGVAWVDDAQVVTKVAAKRYGVRDETTIRIWRAPEDEHERQGDAPTVEQLDLLRSSGYHRGHGDEYAREALAV